MDATEFDQGKQRVFGSQINIGHLYTHARVPPLDTEVLAEAYRVLEELPLTTIPDVGPLPEWSRMVMPRHPFFQGRRDDLQRVARALKREGKLSIGQVAAVTGMGGIGKTQLAVEFVHRYGRYFSGGIFWLNFESAEGVPLEVASCGGAEALALHPDFTELSFATRVQLVLGVWKSKLPRLLVFDNCEDPALLAEWTKLTIGGGGCRILVTTRHGSWQPELGVDTLRLDVLSRTDSVALLRKFVGRNAHTDTFLDGVAKALGDLPLALHLAGSYLRRYSVEIRTDAYLQELNRPDLLEHASMMGRGLSKELLPILHVQHVAQTFHLSYRKLQHSPTDQVARALLFRSALLAPGEPIPRDLLLGTIPDLGDEFLAADALDRLIELGLLEGDGIGPFRLHRLLAAFALQVARDGNETARTDVQAVLLDRLIMANQSSNPGPIFGIESHLRHVGSLALLEGVSDKQSADLCAELGLFLGAAGDIAGARPYLQQALIFREQALGENHPDTATSLNSLAMMLQANGELEAAHPLFERSFHIRERVQGPDDPNTAVALHHLSRLLVDLGQLDAAGPLSERALNIRRRVLGPDHPDTAASFGSLGRLLHEKGDLAAARPLLERSLDIRARMLGSEHPRTTISMNSLGRLLHDQGELDNARLLLESARDIRERILGPDHPRTANSLNNLAQLRQDQGAWTVARPLMERALDICERVLGTNHPNTAASLNSLGGLLHEQGEFEAARSLLERALDICKQVLGPDHPHTATSLTNLARLVHDQGEAESARLLLQHSLDIRERVLGRRHFRTANSLNNLALLLHDMGDLQAAHVHLRRALDICELMLGPNHPNTAASLNNMSRLLQDQGDLETAHLYLDRASSIYERALGSLHPHAIASADNLAHLQGHNRLKPVRYLGAGEMLDRPILM